MTTTANPIRLSSPGSLVAAVPHLLGFTPESSAVLVWMHGDTVTLTQRIDLPTHAIELADWQDAVLTAPLDRLPADDLSMVAVLYSGDDFSSVLLANVIDTIRAWDSPRVEVRDVLTVTADRWRSALCTDPACCPIDGTPIDPAEAVEFIATGSAPLPSRDSLAVTLNPDGPPVGDPIPASDRLAAIAGITDWMQDAGCGPITAHETATALADIRVRDCVLWTLGQPGRDPEDYQTTARFFLSVARQVRDTDAAPALTVAAISAYLAGDGARANEYVTTALRVDPDYSLAGLVTMALGAAFPPAQLASMFASLSFEECLHGAR